MTENEVIPETCDQRGIQKQRMTLRSRPLSADDFLDSLAVASQGWIES
jgi:hypothetical protein